LFLALSELAVEAAAQAIIEHAARMARRPEELRHHWLRISFPLQFNLGG
jgi:hypothetical protein